MIYELRQVLGELEEKRYKYRWEVWLREARRKEIDIDSIIENLKNDISNIETTEDKEEVINKTIKIWEEFKKEKIRLEDIITQYEWQVTLWKMLNIFINLCFINLLWSLVI